MMKWYENFKVGQEVRVIKKIPSWQFENNDGYRGRGANWADDMDKTIGKVFKVVRIDSDIGYLLETSKFTNAQDFWYPVESLQEERVKGLQLEFNFMQEEG